MKTPSIKVGDRVWILRGRRSIKCTFQTIVEVRIDSLNSPTYIVDTGKCKYWILEEDLVSEEIYNSPLYQAMYEQEEA